MITSSRHLGLHKKRHVALAVSGYEFLKPKLNMLFIISI